MIAGDFVEVVYGDKWLPAVSALQVLCFYGLSRSLLGITENLYLASGRPGVRTKINFLQLILMLLLLYPLTMKYGILGTSVAVSVPSALMLILTFSEAGKILKVRFLYLVRTFVPGVVGSLIMVLVIVLLQYFVNFSSAFVLLFSIVSGGVSYLVFLLIAQKETLLEILELLPARR